MFDLKRIREWTGMTQQEFAAHTGIDQGGLSKIEKGLSAASTKLQQKIIDAVSPAVLFINHSPETPVIVQAMIAAGQLDTLEHEPENFEDALRLGKRIGVVTSDQKPFLELVNKSLFESGLTNIPVVGIKIENGEVKPWQIAA